MLTVIIPTIGRPSLTDAIESVENQTIRTKYIIIEDLHEHGAAATRNAAITLVRTSWVGFLDDDDTLDEHYHEWLWQEKDDSDMVIFRMKNSPLIEESIPRSLRIEDLEYNNVGISFAMKTSVARMFPFRHMIGEDYDLIMRIRNAGYKIKISDKVAYYIRGKNGIL